MASGSRVPTSLIGIAGVHYVVSELSRRGLIAMPTTGNTPGIDVLVAEPDGSGQAVLQVKTSDRIKKQQEGRQWWPTSKPDKCLKGFNSFYIFVRYNQNKEKFEAFLENADDVVKHIEDGKFPSWGLPKSVEERERLINNWKTWRPPKVSISPK